MMLEMNYKKSINEFNVVGGAAFVINISNEGINSLVSLLDFAPNKKSEKSWFERLYLTQFHDLSNLELVLIGLASIKNYLY